MSTAQKQLKGVCPTGVEGLDEVLCGGLPSNRLYLVEGHPGAGKTTLALQFLQEGVRLGERSMYITFSETREEIEAVALSHGWDLEKLDLFELSAIEAQLHGETENTFFHPSDVELNRRTKALVEEIERVQPVRLVFDSLSEMRMLAETPLRYRRQVLELKQFLAGRKCTVLLLDDRTAHDNDMQVKSIVHGILRLNRSSPEYGIARRQVSIEKLRGVKFREGNHDLVIVKGGMKVFPRLIPGEYHPAFQRETFSSGIAELDAILGGGLDRGTSNMFMGPPGTGKSTLAMKFAEQFAKRGEPVQMFIFDETIETLLARSDQLDLNMRAHVEAGKIRICQIDPAEISPGELAHRIRDGVIKDGVRMVVIDSINGYLNAMPEERYLSLQLHELLSFLNQHGVITIMVLAQQGLVGVMQSTVDLTYLADTAVLLRYFEARGEVRQALSVIKKRSGNHERTIREIRVGKGGIQVGPPLREMHGVLSGTPTVSAPTPESIASA
jgi:circadian clock protein KaiC